MSQFSIQKGDGGGVCGRRGVMKFRSLEEQC